MKPAEMNLLCKIDLETWEFPFCLRKLISKFVTSYCIFLMSQPNYAPMVGWLAHRSREKELGGEKQKLDGGGTESGSHQSLARRLPPVPPSWRGASASSRAAHLPLPLPQGGTTRRPPW